MTTIAATPAPSTAGSFPTVAAGTVANLTLTLANTEYSHTFPAATKAFLVRGRGAGTIKMAYTAATSGTTYWTIAPGAHVGWSSISAASTTIYLQSPVAGAVVELQSWA